MTYLHDIFADYVGIYKYLVVLEDLGIISEEELRLIDNAISPTDARFWSDMPQIPSGDNGHKLKELLERVEQATDRR